MQYLSERRRRKRGGKNIHSSVLINYSLDRFSWAFEKKKTEFVHERYASQSEEKEKNILRPSELFFVVRFALSSAARRIVMQLKLNAIVCRQIHHCFPSASNFSNDRRIFSFRRPQSDFVATNSYRHDTTGDEATERLSITTRASDDDDERSNETYES